MDISVVIPLYNEEESLPELFAWIQRVMNQNNFTYEVIFVNDGSTDGSWNVIENCPNNIPKPKASNSVGTTANHLPFIAGSHVLQAM